MWSAFVGRQVGVCGAKTSPMVGRYGAEVGLCGAMRDRVSLRCWRAVEGLTRSTTEGRNLWGEKSAFLGKVVPTAPACVSARQRSVFVGKRYATRAFVTKVGLYGAVTR